MPMEFDLTQLFNIAKNEGKRILIPKTLPQRQMIFAEYDKLHLKKLDFGVLEPDGLPEEIPDFFFGAWCCMEFTRTSHWLWRRIL